MTRVAIRASGKRRFKSAAVALCMLSLLSVSVGAAGVSAAEEPLAIGSVRASSHDGNLPRHTLDGDLSTRWSASGDGSWIEYDLGAEKTVGSLAVAFYRGDRRTADFEVRLSSNGSGYTTVLSGAAGSGATTALQSFDFADREARYVRIVGFGNSHNDWNSLTEVEVYGEEAAAGPDYRELARDYADAMVADGRDRYGETRSPLFATMLDRETMRLIPNVKETVPMTREEHGVRESGRSWNAANLDDDHALHGLLYELGKEDASYAEAADDSLRWYATNTQHPTTKMIPWGEHVGWRLDTEGPTRHESKWSDRKHELQLDMIGIWPDAFRVAPDAMEDYSRALWEYHVYDKRDGLHAHQTRYDKYDPDEGYLFPRMAGHMVSVWAHAYADSEDPAFRAEALAWIEKIATTHNARRNPQSDATTQYWGTPRNGGQIGAEVGHSAFNDLQGVIDVHRTLELDVLPEDVAAELRDWTRRSDATFLAIDHPFASGGEGYVNRVELATLDPLSPPGAPEPWCVSYGRVGPVVDRALDVLERYRQTGDDRYLALARAGADWYTGREPECDYVVAGADDPLPLWPGPVADAIELFLGLHEETGEGRYLDEADRLGQFAAETFLDDASALPRVFAPGHHSGYDHYEGHTGGPDLMLALYELDEALGEAPGQ